MRIVEAGKKKFTKLKFILIVKLLRIVEAGNLQRRPTRPTDVMTLTVAKHWKLLNK